MPAHGTRASYGRGCRCVECTSANRVYQREYMRGRSRMVSADGARLDVIEVHGAGESLSGIASRVGYSTAFVSRLAAGRVKRIHRETAEDFAALRSVTPTRKAAS